MDEHKKFNPPDQLHIKADGDLIMLATPLSKFGMRG